MTTDAHDELMLQRYLADLVATASPAQRLLLLFDYLRRDLVAAGEGFDAGDLKEVSDHLVHAQHILFALRDPLDRTTPLGESLAGVYDFCLRELIECNLHKQRNRIAPVKELIEQIAAANRQAATSQSAESSVVDACA
ncbi:MAG: flagellar protein FliS [Actinomycetota bacterium]|nr:flagellar protein FliS [Actinomycetota bacterium]